MNYIGIIVAMDEEKEAILNIMKHVEKRMIYNLQFEIGQIGSKACILVQSGIGKVNAARTTQVLIDNFEIESIINVGSAGAINDLLEIGDVVIAKHVVQHDFDITAFDHPKGYITDIGDYIECDEKLIRQFKELIKSLSNSEYKTKIGIIASGDIFCTEERMKEKINFKFQADVVDMECAAIAQVAILDKIPFISIRSVSDVPNGSNEKTFEENLKLASERCAEIIENFCNYEET